MWCRTNTIYISKLCVMFVDLMEWHIIEVSALIMCTSIYLKWSWARTRLSNLLAWPQVPSLGNTCLGFLLIGFNGEKYILHDFLS